MSALAKLQQDFSHSLYTQTTHNFSHHIKALNQAKSSLINIYHHTTYTIHLKDLEKKYPLVFAIMGIANARQMSRLYIRDNFPQKGTLHDWAGDFATFIKKCEAAAAWPYLADVAYLEWVRHTVSQAPENTTSLEYDKNFATLAGHQEKTFRFRQCCCLVAFSHALKPLIHDLEQNLFETNKKNYFMESCYALVWKHRGKVEIQWLAPSLFAFLNRLKEGQDSEVAIAAARILQPDFNSQSAFDFLLSHPALYK
jgi:hypothetical protein